MRNLQSRANKRIYITIPTFSNKKKIYLKFSISIAMHLSSFEVSQFLFDLYFHFYFLTMNLESEKKYHHHQCKRRVYYFQAAELFINQIKRFFFTSNLKMITRTIFYIIREFLLLFNKLDFFSVWKGHGNGSPAKSNSFADIFGILWNRSKSNFQGVVAKLKRYSSNITVSVLSIMNNSGKLFFTKSCIIIVRSTHHSKKITSK